jgi:chloride channel 7
MSRSREALKELKKKVDITKTKYESLDYDIVENDLYQKEIQAKTSRFFRNRDLARWAMNFVIAVLVGSVAWAVDTGIRSTAYFKFYLANQLNVDCNDCYWNPFLIYLAFNLVLVGVASFLIVFVEPAAGGSGIPEIKSYLNGIKVPHIIRFKTLLCKVFGTLLTVASGIPAGQEGPMIHTGAIVAAGISQGKSTTFKTLDTHLVQYFRNDREKRDFVSGGAAAGVAAAFGAPIGGVLFALEEGASFWNQPLTWRIFFTSLVSTFTFNFLSSGATYNKWGALSQPGLVNFGTFSNQVDHGYSIVHFPFFILMGVIGGLLGALYNHVILKLTLFRMKYLRNRFLKFFEALFLAFVVSVFSFNLSYFVHACRRLRGTDLGPNEGSEINHFQFFCPNGYYNDMATVYFTTQELAIKQLLHNEGEFSFSTLAVFTCIYFALFCWTQGIAASVGVFVPAILTGASYGRLVGQLLNSIGSTWRINPGTFALIGAASFLGGVTRMTIALTVILIEATNDTTYGLPIMITLMVAKWTGDWFNEGLYDIAIEVKQIPLLHWEPPHFMRKFRASDVMARDAVQFSRVEQVEHIHHVLHNTTHNGFPVVHDDGTFAGVILRSQLITLLGHKAFQRNPSGTKSYYQPVSLLDFSADYPRFPPISSVNLGLDDLSQYLDLTPYINQAPFVIQQGSSLSRVFQLFRTMGLRHLVVVDQHNKVVGMITRRDLTHVEDKLGQRHGH